MSKDSQILPTTDDPRNKSEDEIDVKSKDDNDVESGDADSDVESGDTDSDVESEDDSDVESGDEEDDTEGEEDDCAVPPWLDGGRIEFQVRFNANAALKYLNKQEGRQEYELVEPGPVYGATISRGPILHFNFKAKPKDCPDAQVETFFAQMRSYKGLVIDLCVSLGPSEALPHWRNADVTGCQYCGGLVHHPTEKCEKLLWGVKGEDTYWLYGKRQRA